MDLESETFYMMCVCGIGYESPVTGHEVCQIWNETLVL